MDLGTWGLLLLVVTGVPAATVAYALLTERLLMLAPAKRRGAIRPWLWLAPGFAFLTLFLIYPTVRTLIMSFQNRRSEEFVGVDNYFDLFGQDSFWQIVLNTGLWIVFFALVVVVFGVLIAVLADRVRYETAVKALIFVPLAISFVAAGVIWGLMYEFSTQRGTVNAAIGVFGIEPQSWMTEWPRNTFMLIIVGIWMWVGFATVILSAGLKGISTELLEAARMDGATEVQVFFRIILPLLMPTIAVVGTTIVITALKTFDIIYVMTGGNYDTDVIATLFYQERFVNRDAGSAAAVAIILLLAIVPVMLFNIRRFQQQEAIR
ncbi:MAG TPA: sugar ABC transporter permease [Candidatus Limnocylindria bacterium]|nr:sugar ABC transporter permease [Candidatus Limnocylindria bacterium]